MAVVSGFFYPASYAALRGLANKGNNKLAFVQSTEEVFAWYVESLEADDNETWFKPDDTAQIDPGRWKRWNLGGATRVVAVVADLAGLKALGSTAALQLVLVLNPVGGMVRFYEARFGDATAANDLDVVAPTDDGARYFALL